MTDEKIAQHLQAHFDAFLAGIEDAFIVEGLKKYAFYAGGCIYSLANDKAPRDYDLFVTSKHFANQCALAKLGYVTEYAVSRNKTQIVIKYTGDPEKVVGQFDFMHNMFYFIPGTKEIVACSGVSRDCLTTNQLVFNKGRARDIEGVFLRIEKFTSRGMEISNETREFIRGRTTPKKVKNYKKKIERKGHS